MGKDCIRSLELVINSEIEVSKILADEYELEMKALSDKRNIFGRIKKIDDYEKNHRLACCYRTKITDYEFILHMVEEVKRGYYDLDDKFRDLEAKYVKLEEEYKKLEDGYNVQLEMTERRLAFEE